MTAMRVGPLAIDVATRRLSGPRGRTIAEPRVLQVLLTLAAADGKLVTRASLFEQCWGRTPVGDDSLNRAIAALRRVLRDTVGEALKVETVAGAGYFISVTAHAPQPALDHNATAAMAAGWAYWKSGAPIVDTEVLTALRCAVSAHPGSSDLRATLALALRQAVEYSESQDCAKLVAECESEATSALAINPRQPHAASALIGLVPIFGDWLPRRLKLLDLLERLPNDLVALHELAILEMATGRVQAAAALGEQLLRREPLAATFHYKRVYHCWSTGQLGEMDRVADAAMQLWPRHSAIWFARLWSLAFTGRLRHARQHLNDQESRPVLPPPALALIDLTFAALEPTSNAELRQLAIKANLQSAEHGPAHSVAAVMYLSALDALDEALEVAAGFLARRGTVSVGLRKMPTDPTVTDQHRRVTQMLFLPVTAALRKHPGFSQLCEDMGLADYWRRADVVPDFLKDATVR